MEVTAAQLLKREAAELLAQIRDLCRTSQKTVDTLVAGVDKLFDTALDVLKDKLNESCSHLDGHLTLNKVVSVVNALKSQSMFQGVGSKKKMETYMQTHSQGQKVLLQQIILKSRVIVLKGIPRTVPFKFGYIVPFLHQLEQLLNCPDVLECVDNPLPHEDGVFKTVMDGLLYRYHDVVLERGPTTLCFIMHVDDAEPCDPLKSHANEHNLRLFYWVLANIHPKKRSSLRAINLLAIVKAKIAKQFGNDYFLRDFMNAMKMLGTEGVVLTINGALRRFYGILLFVAADNPASANLGKFKETHSALRPCRVCMTTSGELCKHFTEDPALLRTIAEHKTHVKRVLSFQNQNDEDEVEVRNIDVTEPEEDMAVEPTEEKYFDHLNPSINYGVNGKSILSEAPGFDVTKMLPQDLLHLLAEGVVELLIRLILRDLCLPPPPEETRKSKKPLLDLTTVNNVMTTVCDLGHLNHKRPSHIEPGHIKGSKLRQSATQMLALLYLLPFLIYRVCPPNKLDLVLKLIRIVNLCMSFELKISDIEEMKILIEDFGTNFMLAYPKVKTLKLHCLVHLPTQAMLFGPLRQQACFRFEAMHGKFTSLASTIKNMTNFALSSASRHLCTRNLEILQGMEGRNYLYKGDTAKNPEEVSIKKLEDKDCLMKAFPHLSEDSLILKVKEYIQYSNTWHTGVAFLQENSVCNTVFGRIRNVYLLGKEVVFSYQQYNTKFIPSFNAFEIVKCEPQINVVSLSDLKHKFPVLRLSFNFHYGVKVYLIIQSTVETN